MWKTKAEGVTAGIYTFQDEVKEMDLEMKLASEARHNGKDSLIIEFVGKGKTEENGEEWIKGKMFYDYNNKKMLGIEAKTGLNSSILAEEENEKTKTNISADVEAKLNIENK